MTKDDEISTGSCGKCSFCTIDEGVGESKHCKREKVKELKSLRRWAVNKFVNCYESNEIIAELDRRIKRKGEK